MPPYTGGEYDADGVDDGVPDFVATCVCVAVRACDTDGPRLTEGVGDIDGV